VKALSLSSTSNGDELQDVKRIRKLGLSPIVNMLSFNEPDMGVGGLGVAPGIPVSLTLYPDQLNGSFPSTILQTVNVESAIDDLKSVLITIPRGRSTEYLLELARH
jgi:hypothetical protein